MADQLHLIHAYVDDFEKIDHIVVYVKYPIDFVRSEYEPNQTRIQTLSSTPFKIRENIKLLYYASQIGILEPVKNIMVERQDAEGNVSLVENIGEMPKMQIMDSLYIDNFEKLLKQYPIDKSKTSLLMDKRSVSDAFLDYCKANQIDIIDFGQWFEESKRPVTLIYDMHWNNNGRSLVAKSIVEHLQLN